MYILQNALRNIARNKSRNIMIGVIIFAIILTTVVALIINNTAAAVIEDYEGRFGSEVLITPNMEKIREEAMNNNTEGRIAMRVPTLDSELYLQFADSDYLQKSVLSGTVGANSSGIRAIDQEDDVDNDATDGSAELPGGGGQMMGMNTGGNFRLIGDSWQDFSDGIRDIESGEFPENDNECLISTDLRDENSMNIGDIITFTSTVSINYDPDEYPSIEAGDTIIIEGIEYTVIEAMIGGQATREAIYELKVVGVYNDLKEEYANENLPVMAALNSRNEVLTTLPTLLANRNDGEGGIQISATYFLETPDMLASFETEVRTKGLPDTFDVDTDEASYNNIVKPVLGLKSISITFMIVVMVLGGIILLLLTSISIRERKYEIGVLRAMGMKKIKVALGLWIEILAITCVCLVIGLAVGTVAAQPISDMILQNQVEAAENSYPRQMEGVFGRGGGGMLDGNTASTQPLSEMEISLDLITILEIITISILITFLAGLISISKITKYEPIKILMERN